MMAGEIDEPFSHSFRVDSLHSGSISFGRFETESLSWERRSSFSHNRYLEEVEKYSKPGSVTEKKAYFEAHFRKKALLSQSSSECQTGTENQTSENDFSENGGYKEEFEQVNEVSHVAHFDENLDGSEYGGDCEVMECGREDAGNSSSEPQGEPALNNADVVVDSVPEHIKAEKTHQTETGHLLLVNAEPETEVKENLNDEPVNVDVTFKAIDPSPNSHTAGKDDTASSEHQQDPSAENAASETKLTKARSKSQGNVTQVRKNVSSEGSKDSARKPSRREKQKSSHHIMLPQPHVQ
uniref:Protein WVD2-like 7 n=1 Tax=Davidia involucrata TaxID=16924 RepID=A0A5B7AQF1_DAVIN